MRVDVNRDEHAGGDQGHLHGLADAEPENAKRDQRQRRNRTLDLHEAVNNRLAAAGQAGDQRKGEAENNPDPKPQIGALRGGQQVVDEHATHQHVEPGRRGS